MAESDSLLDTGLGIPETLALVPFLLLQVSMVVFILRRGRKDKSFRQAFYVIFVVGTIADCTSVIATRLTLYVYLPITEELWTRSPSLAQALYNFGTAVEHLGYVANNCQPLCHTAIASNRFTAFAFSTKHARKWNRNNVLTLILAILSAAIMLSAAPSVYLGVTYVRLTRKYIEYNDFQGWEIETFYIAGLVRSLNLIICCSVSFALNMGTVFMFVRRRLLSSTQLTSKGQDAKLFVHSLLMFALQLCLTFQCFVASTDWFGFQRLIYENRQPAALVVPRWLQLWSNDWLAGDTYCVVYLADVSPEEGINFCGILYAVLTGYLPVGPDQHLEALIEYVFALSGAPLLLIVSGYARNAYIQFYFKCFRRRNNRVIHVLPTSSTQK